MTLPISAPFAPTEASASATILLNHPTSQKVLGGVVTSTLNRRSIN